MDLARCLRPFRKAIVTTAEKVMKEAFGGRPSLQITKTQLNHLIALCHQAACVEEIENYIRYQASRQGEVRWDMPLAGKVIGEIKDVLQRIEDAAESDYKDLAKVEAWKLYAVFLTRAFAYHKSLSKAQRPPKGKS